MKQKDFSYKYVKENFPESFEKWYIGTNVFDEFVESSINENDIRNIIKSIAKKLRTKDYNFTNNDLDDIKCFIKNSHNLFHSSQWTANFNKDTKLKSGEELNHVDLFNIIKKSANYEESSLDNIFEIKTYNSHFPHLYSIIKNVQDENLYPIFYPHWQDMYKWIKNENKCTYDQLTKFYRDFIGDEILNKYKTFSGTVNAFHIEYLRWCVNTNQGYKITEKLRRKLTNWHYDKEQFLNEINTPMQKMKYINLDKWRLLNESLFKAYIDCYKYLSSKQESEPAKSMVVAMSSHGILKKVNEGDYAQFYTIARELGIFYQDENDQFILGDIAQKYLDGEISYSDYLKHYILNTEFLINGEVVHPFEEIVNSLKNGPLAIDDITQKCIKSIPVNMRIQNASEKLNIFIKRAVDANLIKNEGGNYSILKDFKLTEKAITKSGLDKVAFENKFVGKGKTKQENIVKKMINRKIISDILDDKAVYQTTNELNTILNEPTTQFINNKMKQPLNQILFGPPGTGKTDATVEKALDILELKTKDRSKNREIFRSLLNKKIFFVTMHPSYSYEDFVQGIKPKTSDKGELLFESKSGIFKNIAELCLPYLNSYYFPGFLMSVYEEELRKIVDPKMNQQQLLDYIGKKCGVAGGTIKNTRDYFDNVVGSISSRVGYDDENFIANNIDKEFYFKLSKKYLGTPKNMLLNSFKNNWVDKKSVVTSQEKTESNFVLILDEINRANISKVFGELITLLEEDKRIGKENELSVTLPSGELFSIPPNLYVIGTMNTADKSIALVDIALRRRFQFIPIYPDSTVINDHCKSVDKTEKVSFMDSLNTRLRVDKGVDFQIGHAYFLKDNLLADVINENIIPLLVEYLRNDLEKVKKLLSDLGKPIDEEYYNKTGLLKYIG
jgi:5-methylcytosine-specific restriction protein B